MEVNINTELIEKIKKTLNVESVDDNLIIQLVKIGLNEISDTNEDNGLQLVIE